MKIIQGLFALMLALTAAGALIHSIVELDGAAIIIAAIFGGASALLWFNLGAGGRQNRAGMKAFKALTDETQQFIRDAEKNGRFPDADPGNLMLHGTEFAVLSEASNLSALKERSVSSGVGTRVKIGNLPIYLGQSQSVRQSSIEDFGTGHLVLTNKRLVFNGSTNQIMDLTDITLIESQPDVLLIVAKNGRPLRFKVRNTVLWNTLIRYLSATPLTANALTAGQ